ncbi:MAG: DUF5630 domain-containing protein [Legionella sp.]|jgi:hypothetical protein
MKLPIYLKLSEDEQAKLKTIKSLNDLPNRTIIYNGFIRYDSQLLLKLAIIDPDINKIGSDAQFSDFWIAQWTKIMGRDYESIPTVTCFDLLKSFYLYNEFQRILQKKILTPALVIQAEDALTIAAYYGYFPALNSLCIHGLGILRDEFDPLVADKVVLFAKKAATLYGSPGYLLLSNVYQELYPYQLKNVYPGADLRIKAFDAAVIAQKLEDISSPMLKLAYSGKSLREASDGQIKTFGDALMRLRSMMPLTPEELNEVYTRADKSATDYRETIKEQNSVTIKSTNVALRNSMTP